MDKQELEAMASRLNDRLRPGKHPMAFSWWADYFERRTEARKGILEALAEIRASAAFVEASRLYLQAREQKRLTSRWAVRVRNGWVR